MSRLHTPEEAADHLGHVTAYEIRGMCKRGEISFVKGSRGKILLTAEQIDSIVEHLTTVPRQPSPPEPAPEHGFRTTARSRALSNRAS